MVMNGISCYLICSSNCYKYASALVENKLKQNCFC